MWKNWWTYFLIAFFGCLILGLTILGYLSVYLLPPTKVAAVKQVPGGPRHFELKDRNLSSIYFDLLDPELAPADMKDKVMLGYRIFNNTKKYASQYAGNTLSCNNCHFGGGNTFGEKNGGISLVGVSVVYPRFSKRSGTHITLGERIQNCFMRSMNGVAPATDSKVSEAIIAYLDWISTPVDVAKKEITWLGMNMIDSDHKPDAKKGAEVYTNYCAACHQPNGAGTEGVPPLWGDNSFNDGAGMNTIPRFSAFVYANMPFQQPTLTKEQALDVAAYVTAQPRPQFVMPKD